MGGGARGDDGGHGDSARGGVWPHYSLFGHVGLDDGRARDGGEGDGAGVHAPSQGAAAAVLPAPYSFSAGDCQELELKVTGKGVSQLLEFLAGSFHGGTDVDEPFIRALSRLEEEAWSNADILPVTDGEIRPPDEEMLADLDDAKEEMGLARASGGRARRGRGRRRGACTHTHTFKSWAAVKEARCREGSAADASARATYDSSNRAPTFDANTRVLSPF